MGKTAVRVWKKIAMAEPVFPRSGKDGFHQPSYLRGRMAVQTSPKLKSYQHCMAIELAGKKYTGRLDVQRAFKDAAKKCSGRA